MYGRYRNSATQDNLLKKYFADLKKYPPLSRYEEEKLLKKIREGDPRARSKLISSNLRFVITVAKRYKFINDVPFEDLIAVGNLGLLRAARRFDARRNVRFISFAVWWVRQAIIQTISMHTHQIRIPLNRVHRGLKIKKCEELLCKKLNRNPTLEELADEAGLRSDELRKFLASQPSVISIDSTPVDADEDLLLRDIITDVQTDPLYIIERRVLAEEIQKILAALTDRERIVLKHRFGLQHTRSHTLEEIGKLLGLTRERVRQIEAQALQKLRHPTRIGSLQTLRY